VNFAYEPSGDRAAKFTYNFKSSTLKGWSRYISPGYVVDQFGKVTYFSVGDRKIAKMDKNGDVMWFSHDHLGSTTLVTGRTGARLERTEYAPFGDIRHKSSALTNTDYMYTGQEYDREEMMYYYRSRFYDPAIGRFTTPDAVIPSLIEPKAFHPYSYVGSNPMRYTDPTGQVWEDEIDEAQLHLAHISTLFAGGHVGPGSAYATYLRNVWAQAYENLFVLRMRRWVERVVGGFRLEAFRHWINGNALDLFQALLWDLQAQNVINQFNAIGLPQHVPLNLVANTWETPRQIAERVDHAEALILYNTIHTNRAVNLAGFMGLIFANPVGPDGLAFRSRLRRNMPERALAPVYPGNQGGKGNFGSDKSHPPDL
jgi:RHS repeat-associated protein